jgi:hypothetical protein
MSRSLPSLLDRAAIMLSGACVVHCVGSVILLGMLAGSATWLADPAIHRVGLALAAGLGALALVGGVLRHRVRRPLWFGAAGLSAMMLGLVQPHGLGEAVFTVIGVSLLAYAHILNARAWRTT